VSTMLVSRRRELSITTRVCCKSRPHRKTRGSRGENTRRWGTRVVLRADKRATARQTNPTHNDPQQQTMRKRYQAAKRGLPKKRRLAATTEKTKARPNGRARVRGNSWLGSSWATRDRRVRQRNSARKGSVLLSERRDAPGSNHKHATTLKDRGRSQAGWRIGGRKEPFAQNPRRFVDPRRVKRVRGSVVKVMVRAHSKVSTKTGGERIVGNSNGRDIHERNQKLPKEISRDSTIASPVPVGVETAVGRVR